MKTKQRKTEWGRCYRKELRMTYDENEALWRLAELLEVNESEAIRCAIQYMLDLDYEQLIRYKSSH